jgi:hypothetical protein
VIELEDIGCVERFAHSWLLAMAGGSSTPVALLDSAAANLRNSSFSSRELMQMFRGVWQ